MALPLPCRGFIVAAILGCISGADAASVGLNRTAPTTNANGTPLKDLAGYRVYLGTAAPTCPGGPSHLVSSSTSAPTPAQTVSRRVTGLTASATYFVRVTAVDTAGNESACSPMVSGVARSDITVTPGATVSFGSLAAGATANRTFTVQNTGTANVSGTASTGPPFTIVSGGSFSLAPGASQAVVVRFRPTAAGTFAGNANFTVNGDTVSRGINGAATGLGTPALPSPPSGTGGSLRVFITQPRGGATVGGSGTAVLWAEGTSGAANTFTLSVDGVATGRQTTSARGPVTLPWTSIPNGTHTLTATVRDAGGKTGSTRITVRVAGSSATAPAPAPPPPAPTPPAIQLLMHHPELGGSTYDTHADGSGVCHVSRLRPIVNVRPTGRLWNLFLDLCLLDWLEGHEQPYDVITDDDLHAEGLPLLDGYSVILTGCHPEYCSREVMDALAAYLGRGGRLMYMGGNGFYWRVSYPAAHPGMIEMRRAEDGTRAWAESVGEYYHSSTGEYGGLWRRQGRAPNTLVGVGFVAQGFDRSSYYRRTPASRDPRARFIFDGIVGDVLGDFGVAGGGAAGLELDAFNPSLGSPAWALVVASSEDHSNAFQLVNEEMNVSFAGSDGRFSPAVRADMVFYEHPGGGAVFSTGSIAYVGSLAHKGYDNNISRLTLNVLRRFLDPAPFATP